MSPGHKTTSPLEGGVNCPMKKKYAKTVNPTMCLKTSLKTQHTQQQSKMKHYLVDTLKKFESTPTWHNSSTGNTFVPVAESQLQQNLHQGQFYLCKVTQNCSTQFQESIIQMVQK